jgi:hypothetical protein
LFLLILDYRHIKLLLVFFAVLFAVNVLFIDLLEFFLVNALISVDIFLKIEF